MSGDDADDRPPPPPKYIKVLVNPLRPVLEDGTPNTHVPRPLSRQLNPAYLEYCERFPQAKAADDAAAAAEAKAIMAAYRESLNDPVTRRSFVADDLVRAGIDPSHAADLARLLVPDSVPAVAVNPAGPADHADGPEGGSWVWWKGERHDVPEGVVYRLIVHFWDRDWATYAALCENVFLGEVEDQTFRSKLSEASKVLKRIGVPWRLKANARERIATKVPR